MSYVVFLVCLLHVYVFFVVVAFVLLNVLVAIFALILLHAFVCSLIVAVI